MRLFLILSEIVFVLYYYCMDKKLKEKLFKSILWVMFECKVEIHYKYWQILVFSVKLNRLTLGENMEEKIIYYGTLLELYGELLTDKQYSAIDKYYNMDLSL